MTILITGASSGIGKALALEAARRGYNVALLARRKEVMDQIAQQIETMGVKALALSGDVLDRKTLDVAVKEIESKLGDIDTVIANAGFGVVGDVSTLQRADFERQFNTNVFGVIETFQAVWPSLKKSRGAFAVTGSVNGYVALPGNSPYAMSKFAVRALCDCLRFEVAENGVSVTHIAPGFVESEIRQVDNFGKHHERAKDPVPQWIQMPAPRAAKLILRSIEKRKAEVVITGHGKIFVWWARFFPGFLRWFIRVAKISARPRVK